jgi:hypothetical protein
VAQEVCHMTLRLPDPKYRRLIELGRLSPYRTLSFQ